jgi:hypothetical protein
MLKCSKHLQWKISCHGSCVFGSAVDTYTLNPDSDAGFQALVEIVEMYIY